MTYSTIRPHLPRAALAGALGLLAYTGWAWSGTSPTESTDDAAVVADHTVVAPQVSGFIQEVLAEDNQSVAAGQLLARIDDREYVAALAAARADLAVASAQLVNANATLERHQAVISQALAVTPTPPTCASPRAKSSATATWRARAPARARPMSRPAAAWT